MAMHSSVHLSLIFTFFQQQHLSTILNRKLNHPIAYTTQQYSTGYGDDHSAAVQQIQYRLWW